MKSAADFRRIARESLKGKWVIALVAGFLALLLGVGSWSGPSFQVEKNLSGGEVQASIDLLGQKIALFNLEQGLEWGFFAASAMTYIAILAIVLAIVRLVIGAIMAVGYARFNLDLVDGKDVSLGTLFQYFSQWKTMLIAELLQGLYIFLWSLLLIIPGVIAAFRYAMTEYILAENPELRASEAIDRSKEMMIGNKWRLFCLMLSFIGWMFLSVLTLGIGDLWLNPYMEAARAAFYREVSAVEETGNPVAEALLQE